MLNYRKFEIETSLLPYMLKYEGIQYLLGKR